MKNEKLKKVVFNRIKVIYYVKKKLESSTKQKYFSIIEKYAMFKESTESLACNRSLKNKSAR